MNAASAVRVVQAVHAAADTESRLLDALAAGPLPLHEVAERTGHGITATECFLRYLRARGAVTRTPGPGGVLVWHLARTGIAT